MGGDIEKFCYAATVRSPPFPQDLVKKCGGKDGGFSPFPRLIVKKRMRLKKGASFFVWVSKIKGEAIVMQTTFAAPASLWQAGGRSRQTGPSRPGRPERRK